MIAETYEYKLIRPIEISDGGQSGTGTMVEVDSILLIAPCGIHSKSATALQHIVQKSLSAQKSDREPTEDEKKKAEADRDKDKGKPTRERFPAKDVINVIATSDSPGNALEDSKGLIMSLLTNGCGEMNGKTVKQGDFGKLGLQDIQNITGEYIANFLSEHLFG